MQKEEEEEEDEWLGGWQAGRQTDRKQRDTHRKTDRNKMMHKEFLANSTSNGHLGTWAGEHKAELCAGGSNKNKTNIHNIQYDPYRDVLIHVWKTLHKPRCSSSAGSCENKQTEEIYHLSHWQLGLEACNFEKGNMPGDEMWERSELPSSLREVSSLH